MKLLLTAIIGLLFFATSLCASPAQHRSIRIAAFNFYPAIFQAKDGSVQGFYVDFLKEIAKQEGWNIEYVYGNWSDGLARIKTGEVDVLTNVAFTNERATFMDFGKTPLLTVWAELYVPKNSTIDTIRQVKGKKIALMKGDFNAANFRNLVEKFEIPCTYVEYGNFEEVFKAISARHVDGGIVNNTFGAAKQREYKDVKTSGVIFNPFDIYFTVAKGKNQKIIETLDSYLTKWRKEESSPYHLARARWSHGSASTIPVTPAWLFRSIIVLLILSGVAVGFIFLLRLQVRRKTSELKSEIDERIRIAEELHIATKQLEEELAERQMAQETLQEQATQLEEEVAERQLIQERLEQEISERKQIEEQLMQSQKMEAVGHLAGGVAHDFNNILQVIMGYGSMLKMDTKLDDTHREEIEEIIAATERASQLTKGLLAFSRKQIMNPQKANLNDIVQHVQKFLVRIIGEDIQFRLVFNEHDLPVMVDSTQIEQVLINLAANARDAMPRGGLLTVETGIQEVDASFIDHHGFGNPGPYAVITLADTGRGMDEDTCKRIFEPFFTTKEIGKGTGLGMAIVYGIVKQHNGFINVYSEQGQGTTFRIYIPVTGREQEGLEETIVQEQPRGGIETVLVAEDEPGVRKLTVNILTKFGYEVIQAEDGQDCVDKFTEHRDKVRLILMDMIMPKKSGKAAYEEICRMQPGVRVLYSSGYTADFIQNRGVADEEIELIMKPIQPMELLRKVRELLDR